MFGTDQLAIHLNSMVINEFGEAFNHIDIAAFEARLIGVAGTLYIGVPVLQQGRKVDFVCTCIKPIIWSVFVDCFRYLGCIPHDFFRYAPDVHARSTQ